MDKNTALNKEINLVPTEEIAEEPANKFFSWVLTVGRYLVVVSEAFLILIWLGRFKFDVDINDIKEVITTKAKMIESNSSFEQEFLEVQSRLQVADTLIQGSPDHATFFSFLEKNIPLDVTLARFALTKDNNLLLSGSSASYPGVAQLIDAFRADPRFGNIILLSLGRREEDNQITFSLQAHLGIEAVPTPLSAPGVQ